MGEPTSRPDGLADAQLDLLADQGDGGHQSAPEVPPGLLRTRFWQTLVHQRQADLVARSVQQMLQHLDFAEDMQRTGEEVDGTRTSPFSMRRTVEKDAPMRSASRSLRDMAAPAPSEMSLPSLWMARSTGRGIGDSSANRSQRDS